MSGPIVASTNVVAIAVVIAAATTTASAAGTDAGACAGAACRATRVMLLEVVKMLVVVVGGYLFERIWGSAVVAKMILKDALLLVDLIYRSSSIGFKWWT